MKKKKIIEKYESLMRFNYAHHSVLSNLKKHYFFTLSVLSIIECNKNIDKKIDVVKKIRPSLLFIREIWIKKLKKFEQNVNSENEQQHNKITCE